MRRSLLLSSTVGCLLCVAACVAVQLCGAAAADADGQARRELASSLGPDAAVISSPSGGKFAYASSVSFVWSQSNKNMDSYINAGYVWYVQIFSTKGCKQSDTGAGPSTPVGVWQSPKYTTSPSATLGSHTAAFPVASFQGQTGDSGDMYLGSGVPLYWNILTVDKSTKANGSYGSWAVSAQCLAITFIPSPTPDLPVNVSPKGNVYPGFNFTWKQTNANKDPWALNWVVNVYTESTCGSANNYGYYAYTTDGSFRPSSPVGLISESSLDLAYVGDNSDITGGLMLGTPYYWNVAVLDANPDNSTQQEYFSGFYSKQCFAFMVQAAPSPHALPRPPPPRPPSPPSKGAPKPPPSPRAR